jgi:hypothetical protein
MYHPFRLIAALAFGLAVLAVGAPPAGAADGVPLPQLAAPAKGESCVEPTDVMRRKHPDFLKKQRDDTMHLGIRDGKYSLNGCIECHAAPDPDAADPSERSIAGFCEECHAYAAVTVDCWSCHNPKRVDRPKVAGKPETFGETPPDLLAQLRSHLFEGSAKP